MLIKFHLTLEQLGKLVRGPLSNLHQHIPTQTKSE